MKAVPFYERYWQHTGNTPVHDIDVATRKKALGAALSQIAAGELVLDAGCGSGEFTEFLLGHGYRVISLDLARTATLQAQQRIPSGDFEIASLEEGLAFQDNIFSVIWFSEVIEHIFDIHAAFSELNRVTRPNGLLILTTPHHGFIKNLIITLTRFEKHYNPYLSHIRFFTHKTLDMCLQRTGFKIERYSGVGRFWPIWSSCFVVARKVGQPQPPPIIIG